MKSHPVLFGWWSTYNQQVANCWCFSPSWQVATHALTHSYLGQSCHSMCHLYLDKRLNCSFTLLKNTWNDLPFQAGDFVHNDYVHIIQCLHGNQVSNSIINAFSTAACSGVHLSNPLDLQIIDCHQQWHVLWHSGHMFTMSLHISVHLAVVSFLPSICFLIVDRLCSLHRLTCQHVLRHPLLPDRRPQSPFKGAQTNTTGKQPVC